MGLIGGILKIVALILLALVGLSAFLWFTDHEAQATITEKGRDGGGDYVVIRPKLIPYDYKQPLDASSAAFVCEGYDVTYALQSGHYKVMDEEGRLVYDSNEGLTDAFSPLRCSVLGL